MQKNSNRHHIREIIKEKRIQITPAEREKSGLAAANHLEQSELFKQSHHIACYLTKGAEFSTHAIIEVIWRYKKQCYLPVVDPVKPHEMFFVRYEKQDKLIKNRFGIDEPALDQQKTISPKLLDLVLMPLFAFDQAGNRVGSGGGYYDHVFSFLKQNQKLKKPVLCGLAYTLQEVSHIEYQSWDVPMNYILTEKGLVFCR